MPSSELIMTFDPNTIEHLGVRMYSTLPPVLAELIANAYDADAKHVTLTLNDENEEKEIVIEDDGEGMAFDDINDKFLRIGRNRRFEEKKDITRKGRKIIGKKGLGKLSFFGIAHQIEISTRQGGKENIFAMGWEDIKSEQSEYRPKIIQLNAPCPPGNHGTKIVLRKIQRETDFAPEVLANRLSKIFIIDADFEVKIIHNSKDATFVSNDRRFSDLDREVEWRIPRDGDIEGDYDKADRIVGHLLATKKPIPPNTNMRGITLFSRKKLVNTPEYFSDSTSSHFFSYLTGWLEVDFIDELEDDVIATNRQSLNWGHDEMRELRSYLRNLINSLEPDWREKRKEIRENKISATTGINIPEWLGKVPGDLRDNVDPLIQILFRHAELPEETDKEAVEKLHRIVPEYAYYHWRQLHTEIHSVSESPYQKEEYYSAFFEAVKKYIDAVRAKSGSSTRIDANMMNEVFGKHSILQVAQHFTKSDGGTFPERTTNGIEDGQQSFSVGVISGGRNPVSHTLVKDLSESGLFTEKDCLDLLSLLSHLFTRLDEAQKKT